MMQHPSSSSTICAVATAPGTGGIAVVRISGPDAIAIVEQLYSPKNKSLILSHQQPYTVTYGTIHTKKREMIDDVLVTLFRNPHSYTGEDLVEISCHGSPYIQHKILELLLATGCRLADPGEFTQRAFLNGRMDLSQAEAVADLIASQSESTHRMAIHQMRGGFSMQLSELRTQLLDFVSLIELELDFSEEDVEFADRTKLKQLIEGIQQHLTRLSDTFRVGNALKSGIPVALVGETNVGKSTLLNVLLNDDKAIVSDIHGTTRDVIEDTISVRGVQFRFIDTAGIRKTTDTIESMGIERTFKKIEQATIVLWILDATSISEHMEWLTERIFRKAEGKKVILVFNKLDKITVEEREVLEQLFDNYDVERIYISAKNRHNTHLLEEALIRASQIPEIHPGDLVVSNIRHYEALQHALIAIQRVNEGLDSGISGDFLSQDIRECMFHLGSITGQISNDEILGNIFSKFCIGK